MNTAYRWFSGGCLALVVGCGANSTDTDTGGKTNWLGHCDEDADCSELSQAVCADQRCTRLCETDEVCSAVGPLTECQAVRAAAHAGEQACLPVEPGAGDAAVGSTTTDDTTPAGSAETQPTDLSEAGTSSLNTDPAQPCTLETCDAGGGSTTLVESGVDSGADAECYSPSQNLDLAYTPGAQGCVCEGTEADVCMQGAALICIEQRWVAVEDGPCEPMPVTCIDPDSNVELTYDCDVPFCACDTEPNEVVCREGADSAQYALVCRDGFWEAGDNSLCAPETEECFSPTQNVDLARSGNLPGCACSDDDFACGLGTTRVPMWCSDSRWRARSGRDCEGLNDDICALPPEPDPGECPDGGVALEPDNCDEDVCHVSVRLRATNLSVLGWNPGGGAAVEVTPDDVLSIAQAAATTAGSDVSDFEVSGPDAGVYLAYAEPLDSGAMVLVSEGTGEVLSAGSVIWDGSGGYWEPQTWLQSPFLTCGAATPTTSHTEESECGELPGAQAALDAVLGSGQAAYYAEQGEFSAYSYLYTPSQGACSPELAEYIVVLTRRNAAN